MAIFRGPGGSGDATTDSTTQALAATQAAADALASKNAAAASATSASASATNAAASAASISANVNAALTIGSGLSGTSYNGSAAVTITNSLPMTYPSSGIAVSTSTAWTTSLTAPSGAIVGTTDTQTLTNKRVTTRVTSITGSAGGTITPTGDTTDQYNITALGAAATFAIPSGTPSDGQKLLIRIEDNGTGRALTWTTSAGGYRVIGTTLPTTTTATKNIYVGCIYNSADVFWDVVAIATQA